MLEQDSTTNKEADKGRGVQLPPLPENSNIRIYVDKERDEKGRDESRHKLPGISMRAIWAWGAGIVSGIAGAFGASMHAQDKMLEFETRVSNESVDRITGKGGIGAAIAENGGLNHPQGFFGNMGTGMNSHLVEEAVGDRLLLLEPEKYNFARWMRRIGGKGTYALGAGVAAGAAIGLATYAILPADKKKPDEKSGDWQSRVDTDKDQPRNLG